jgi:hypothetical protein
MRPVVDYHGLSISFEEYIGNGYDRVKAFVKKGRYYKELRSLLTTLLKHGFRFIMVDDSEEFVKTTTKDEVSMILGNLDEGQLLVKNKEGKERWIMIVFGNEPGYLVPDYHVDPDLDKAMDEHLKRWEEN